MDPQHILIILTVAGALAVAVLGWIESGEDFDVRKFGASVGRAIIGGLLAALIFEGTTDRRRRRRPQAQRSHRLRPKDRIAASDTSCDARP